MPATMTRAVHEEVAATDPATQRFVGLQQRLLEHYGVRATSRFVRLRSPAMRAHVLEAGQGPPLVIFHGGDGEAVDWAPLMRHLQHVAHIYAVDRPGCGLSDAFDYRKVDLRRHATAFVESIFDALGLASATLASGSMGGFFVLAAAIELPWRVDHAIFAGYPVGMSSQIPLPGTWETLLPRVGRPRGLRPEVYLGGELHRIQAPALHVSDLIAGSMAGEP